MQASGLDGVVVAETALSYIDGERGELIIGGVRLAELTERASVADVASILWSKPVTKSALALGRQRAFDLVSDSLATGTNVPSMGALSAAVARLATDAGALESLPLLLCLLLPGTVAVEASRPSLPTLSSITEVTFFAWSTV